MSKKVNTRVTPAELAYVKKLDLSKVPDDNGWANSILCILKEDYYNYAQKRGIPHVELNYSLNNLIAYGITGELNYDAR